MNKNKHFSLILAVAMLAAGVLILLVALGTTARQADAGGETLQLDHTLWGVAELVWGAAGVFSETLTVPSPAELADLPDMGEIDIAFLLDSTAGTVTGYVDLSNSLVFTTEHSVAVTSMLSTTQVAAGPAVSGSYDGSALVLTSERFVYTTQAAQTVERQFWLSGTVSAETITGEYRETVWDFGLDPLTIVGTFELKVIDTPVSVPTSVGLLGTGNSGTTIGVILAMLVVLLGAVTWWFRPKQPR